MKFNSFSSSSSKPTQRAKPKRRAEPTQNPKVPSCPSDAYIPHHRNLDLPPDASAEEIKAAWRRLILRLHPDKIRNPAMKDNATAAIILVNEAHEKLTKDKGNWLRRSKNSLLDLDTFLTDVNEWSRRLQEDEACFKSVRRKPWFWAYKTQKECENDGDYFCGEFWATLGHGLFQYLRSVSDLVWDVVDNDWRYPVPPGPPVEVLTFYGPCSETYTVTVPVLDAQQPQIGPPTWSSFRNTPYNTLFAGDAFPVFDLTLLAILIAILLFVFGRLIKRVISFGFHMLVFGLLLSLWCVLWPGKKASMLCVWSFQKLFSVIRRVFRAVLGKLDEIMQKTKLYLYGTRILRLVFYMLELAHAWQEKGFSVREIWREKGFEVNIQTSRRRTRRDR